MVNEYYVRTADLAVIIIYRMDFFGDAQNNFIQHRCVTHLYDSFSLPLFPTFCQKRKPKLS